MNTPSITELLNQSFAKGADQVAIVRQPKGVSPAGVMVLLVGKAAVEKIGGAFLTFVKAKEHGFGDPAKLVELDFHKSTDDIFNWLDRLNREGGGGARRWAYGIFYLSVRSKTPAVRHPGLPVAGAIVQDHRRDRERCALIAISGTELCVKLAGELTARGLPVSLT